jgi:hypothetical protein
MMPRRHLASLALVVLLVIGFAAVGIWHTTVHGMHHAAPAAPAMHQGHHHGH